MDFISLRKMPLSHVAAINSFRERLIVCYSTLFFHIALSMHTDISNWPCYKKLQWNLKLRSSNLSIVFIYYCSVIVKV